MNHQYFASPVVVFYLELWYLKSPLSVANFRFHIQALCVEKLCDVVGESDMAPPNGRPGMHKVTWETLYSELYN